MGSDRALRQLMGQIRESAVLGKLSKQGVLAEKA